MIRKLFSEINLDHLISNYKRIGKIVGERKIIAVVKADAYGHGAVEVAKRLETEGVYALGVAYLSEAIELRESGVRSRIIVFFDNDNLDEYFRYNLIPVIINESSIPGFEKAVRRYDKPIEIHVKIDTGMGRVGFLADGCLKKIDEIVRNNGIILSGIMSHFSDADLKDRSFAQFQLAKFKEIITELKKRGLTITAHIANSAGIMTFPDSHLDAVRPGLMLYGYSPVQDVDGLLPVMKVKTRLVSVRRVPSGTPISYGRTFITTRPSLIGVIPAGYADGYRRAFSNTAYVGVHGRKAPVVGRVCMDLTMIDLTEIDKVREGDEVIILSDNPLHGPTASEMATLADTISYEILTSLGSNAERIYN